MEVAVVTGLLYGDEGKGAVVQKLSKYYKEKGLSVVVMRTGGGQNCGHKVYYGNKSHIHSIIPSCSLNDEDMNTIYDGETICPLHFKMERESYQKEGLYMSTGLNIYRPIPLTTYCEIWVSMLGFESPISTTGTGFGPTIERHERLFPKLYSSDCYYPEMFRRKLEKVEEFWSNQYPSMLTDSKFIELKKGWLDSIQSFKFLLEHQSLSMLLQYTDVLILEGNQGVLLDSHHGLFPHVTRARTVPERANNFINFIKEFVVVDQVVYYDVMRTFGTAHSSSPLINPTKEESSKLASILVEGKESNEYNGYQGRFEAFYHNYEEIQYALKVLQGYKLPNSKSFLVTTWSDLVPSILLKSDYDKDWNGEFDVNNILLSSYAGYVKSYGPKAEDGFSYTLH